MKAVFAIGTGSLLISMMFGCSDSNIFSGGNPSENKAALVGVWNCLTKVGDTATGLADDKTFSADGWYTSSKFPEGKKYGYSVDGHKLIISFPTRSWTENVTRLTNGSLEYSSGKPGQLTSVTCQKKS